MTGEELRQARQALGLTQEQLADPLTVAPNTIARWERGERPIPHPGMLALALEALRERTTKAASIEFWEATQGEVAR